MKSLKGKVALVTGGSRGMGRAIVEDLASAGADVAFIYYEVPGQQTEAQRAEEVLDWLKERGGRGMFFEATVDIADVDRASGPDRPRSAASGVDFARAQRIAETVIDAWGRLDILVNSSGVDENEVIWTMDEQQWERVLDANLKGVFNYTRAVAPIFLNQRSGKIVSIASIDGLRGRPAGPSYSAANAGVIGLTKSVARDLGPYGVNVNAVAPGIIETAIVRALPEEVKAGLAADIVMSRLGRPEDVAHLVCFLCSDLASHIHGEVISVDGGQYI